MTAPAMLIAMLAGIAGATALLGVARVAYSPTRRVRERFHALAPAGAAAFDLELLRDRRASNLGLLDAALRRRVWTERTRTALERAGLPLRGGEWLLLRAVTAAVGGVLGALLARSVGGGAAVPLLLAVGALLGAYAPEAYLRRRSARRAREIEEQLVQLCELMASMMSSGFGYLQALSSASDRLLPPLSVEVARMLDAISLGAEIDQALAETNRRLNSADFDIIATAITIQRSTGGHLGELLQGVAETIRDRQSLRREVRTLAAQQRFSALLVAALPFGLAALLTMLLPDPFGRLLTEPAGRVMLGAAVLMDALAFLVIRRASRIEFQMEALLALLASLTGASLLGSLFLLRQRALAARHDFRRRAGDGPDQQLQRPFRERVVQPLLRRATELPARLLPPRLLAAVEARRLTAGLRLSLRALLATWAALALSTPALFVAIELRAGVGGTLLLVLSLAGLVGGAFVPWYWLARRARQRTVRIERALPDAIDFVVTSVEAGVGLQAAMLNMARKFEGPLADELLRAVRETALGRSCEAALQAMAVRCNSHDLSMLVNAIVHAEQTGMPIGRVLRNQALELRERRRHRAREEANKVPVRMTVPTVLLVFPTMFVLILGPVALRALDVFRS